MNAHLKNKEIFEKTGMMLSDLPEQYIQDHPQRILATIQKRTLSWGVETKVCFLVHFDDPEIRVKKRSDEQEAIGIVHLHLDVCPANSRLVVLFDYFEKNNMSVWFYGRQYLGNFYVKYFQPKRKDVLDERCFQYLIQRTAIPYDIPEEIHWSPKAPEELDDIVQLNLLYDMFRDEYPDEIRTWIDSNRTNSRYKVLPFMRTDWRPPTLNLPSVQEAKKYLDSHVFGMEETKLQILQYLEKVRRSGSLARNLLLVGPPGTGKTTIAQCLAALFNLPMSVVPMGAMLDGETFFGFGETYSGSQEGLFTTAILSPLRYLPEGGVRTEHQIAQVVFLNELDKVPDTYKSGSIFAGLLRATDANRCFYDVYYQASIPLKNVLILADANELSISEPLLNRFHIIEIPGYTKAEKEAIFKRFIFPGALKEACVEAREVAVTGAAISLIAQRCTAPGVREEQHVADKIIGDYLMHYAGRKSTVYYNPDMVEAFLPKAAELRQVNLPACPGSVRSIVCHNGKSEGVQVLADIRIAKQQSFRVYGTTNPLLVQEIEAATLHACSYLPHGCYDIAVQLIGLPEDAGVGELSLAAFMAVLSSFHGTTIPCTFYGAVTLLGGMTSFHCSSPDAVMEYADVSGITSVYTATGFADRLKSPHTCKAVELLAANVAYSLFFDSGHPRGLQAG